MPPDIKNLASAIKKVEAPFVGLRLVLTYFIHASKLIVGAPALPLRRHRLPDDLGCKPESSSRHFRTGTDPHGRECTFRNPRVQPNELWETLRKKYTRIIIDSPP